MGKAKKGKKLDYEDDVDEIETEKTVVDDDLSSKTKKKEKKGKIVENAAASDSEDDSISKKKKSKKKTKNDDVDDISDSVKELTISSNKIKKEKKKGSTGLDNNEIVKDKKVSKQKKSRKDSDSWDEEEDFVENKKEAAGKKGGFSMLAISDGEDEPEEEFHEELTKDDEGEEPVKAKETKKEKGGKKSKKKKKDDDEDLDQILAELEMEYSGQKPLPKEEPEVVEQQMEKEKQEEKESKKKLKKAKKKEEQQQQQQQQQQQEEVKLEQEDGDEEDVKTVKTAAQKRKEKKEKEKQKRMAEKMLEKTKEKEETPPPALEEKVEEETAQKPVEEVPEEDEDDDKKKKKKKKGAKEEKDKAKGVPSKKTIAAMQEALRKIKEEEEKAKKEEEERLKREEEAERQREEQLRLEQERKNRKKAKEKERKERLKAEGKLLTPKQKAEKARAEAMIEAMKAMYGANVQQPAGMGNQRQQQMLYKKKKKQQQQQAEAEVKQDVVSEKVPEPPKVEEEVVEKKVEEEEEDDGVKESWDADSDEEEKQTSTGNTKAAEEVKTASEKVQVNGTEGKDDVSEEESESGSESESEGSDSESDEEDNEDKKTDAEKKKEKVISRIKARQEDAEKKRTLDELRAAVVCVLGHVDTGKTKTLDKLRRTNVQDGEAGGITQQIGATNVPIDAIKEQTRHVKGFSQIELKIPGLLIIDTPGHESFSNLRLRGSSLCDIAVLVVDIMHGLEPQTIESLNLLKQRKTPFLVALNKIDRLYDWQTMNRKDIRDIIKGQAPNTQLEFEERCKEVIVQFAEQGMNAALFYENPDVRSYISLVPTSAITGEGIGNLMSLIVESCQTLLAKRLMFSEELLATVLEVKAIPGLGTTIDVILVNGYLKEGDTIVLAGTEAPIVTQIRSLLMPQPLKELRVKNAYVEYKEVKAAQGVKIAAKDLEKVIAGLNLRVAHKTDEIDVLKEEVGHELKSALSSIRLQERGVYVQASTLGSLEALLQFLKSSSIPYSNIRIGPVVKKDVMKASTMLEHDNQYATILAFDVKIERDAQELADTLGVKIFHADIIYHLFDKFMAYREELKNRKREEFKNVAVFPCKLRILPQFVFNSRDPIVVGVMVEAGIVKEGTPMCVPSKEFVDIGVVTSIEVNHKPQETARKGQEVCIKIEPIPGEAPKMFGRHFDENDLIISKISRQSIDACKNYFREDLVKTDWQLMVELKKLFQIL